MSEAPNNYVIKVYDTKAKAQTGLASEALHVSSSSSDPIITNNTASGNIDATAAAAGNSGTTLVANAPIFGSNMVGWTIDDDGVSAPTTISSYTNPTQVTTAGAHGVANDEGFTIEPVDGSQPMFFTYKKYFFRIEATDPVSGFIIDWDDGEDNSPENANRQEIILDNVAYYAIVEHVYTKHGKFYPMVRTISPEGFKSKFYVSYGAQNDSTNTLKGLENRVLEYSPRDAGDAQNNSSIVSPDVQQGSGQNPRIPEFAPANIPPVAILKTDRTSVYSGIDNTPIESLTSPKAYCFVVGDSSRTITTVSIADVEVIYETSTNQIVKETVTAINNTGTANIQAVDFPATGNLKRILSVKLGELRETTDKTSTSQLMADERIWVKVYDTNSSGTPDSTADTDLSFVSNGCPIQTLDRPGFFVTADGSESITRNSNLSINKYMFDTGKALANANSASATTTIQNTADVTISGDRIGQQTSDIFSNGNGTDHQPVQTTPTIKISYSLSPNKDGLIYDADTMLHYDEERLIRLQVRDNASSTRVDTTKDTIEASYIEHWDPINYSGDTLGTMVVPDNYTTRGLLLYGNFTNGTSVPSNFQWSSRATDCNLLALTADGANGDAGIVFGGTTKVPTTAGATNDTQLVAFDSASDSKGRPGNYLLMGQDKKFNQVHFRLSNNGARRAVHTSISGTAANQIRMRAWYAAPKTQGSTALVWKPLSIQDGTSLGFDGSSLRKSGSITFELPEDWTKCQSTDLDTGGAWTGPEAGMEDSTSGTNAPEDVWTKDMYAILIGITCVESAYQGQMRCNYVFPYTNTHSQAVQVKDPHHKSLNDIAIAQSISWARTGEYANIKDKYGRTEIRKIGAMGGSLTFGGVELSGSYSNQKKLLNKYHRKGTPVYLDVQRAVDSGEYIRFYGVLTDMSEDYPMGNQNPKFALTMQIEYVVEYDSSGDWVSDGLMALGGEVINEPKYTL